MKRREFLKGASTAAAALGAGVGLPSGAARAQARAATLRVVQEALPNTLDPAGLGGNPAANGYSWNVYDRLLTFGRQTLPGGSEAYDYYKLEPELAESWQESSTGTAVTFKLRQGATFHDGTPVTTADVKWSLDRAVSVTVAKNQLGTGSLEKPEQFVVVDPHTLRVDLPRKDRYTLPNLTISFPAIMNSALIKKSAAADDPWGAEWLKRNSAGGGGYKLENYEPGQQLVLARHDGWKSGPRPAFERIIQQLVPTAANRRALIERGDADVAMDVLPRDIADLDQTGKYTIVSTPQVNAFQFIAMNSQMKPFDDVRVRQAVAHALPYKAMFDAALLGRGRPLYGGPAGAPASNAFPAPHPYNTDLDKAKALLAAAGLPNGFETTFSFDISGASIAEPVAALVQESLGKVGIKVTINKVPSAQIGELQTKKELPFFYFTSAAWLRDTDYFFRIFYQGTTRWNFGNFNNQEVVKLVADARWETDPAKYDAMTKRMIQIANEQAPMLMLWQQAQELAAQKSVKGFVYYFHRQVDFRKLTRA
ncbi:MAG: ABC transporter substrate-binding protein [Alphaproteobacteria bacterium]|nr:ABC transporter substrate-binding protein [Alphaproteobacteria bacterium]